jgi:hypothetical protein
MSHTAFRIFGGLLIIISGISFLFACTLYFLERFNVLEWTAAHSYLIMGLYSLAPLALIAGGIAALIQFKRLQQVGRLRRWHVINATINIIVGGLFLVYRMANLVLSLYFLSARTDPFYNPFADPWFSAARILFDILYFASFIIFYYSVFRSQELNFPSTALVFASCIVMGMLCLIGVSYVGVLFAIGMGMLCLIGVSYVGVLSASAIMIAEVIVKVLLFLVAIALVYAALFRVRKMDSRLVPWAIAAGVTILLYFLMQIFFSINMTWGFDVMVINTIFSTAILYAFFVLRGLLIFRVPADLL